MRYGMRAVRSRGERSARMESRQERDVRSESDHGDEVPRDDESELTETELARVAGGGPTISEILITKPTD
jgi:hypothetical protein